MGLFKSIRKKLRRRAQKAEYRREFAEFQALASAAGNRLSVNWADRWPVLGEKTSESGFDRHYIYHTAWATRVLARTRPALHVDVSSSVYFIALASAIVPIRQYEFRPPNMVLEGLETCQGSLQSLPMADASVDSLSCMHVIEHVGLGRYGDPLDANGDLKAIAELRRVLAPGGQLLFVVPLGRPRVQFNAHRIYSFAQAVQPFAGLTLEEFALIPDKAETGHLVKGAPAALCDQQEHGCGCFLFRRPSQAQ